MCAVRRATSARSDGGSGVLSVAIGIWPRYRAGTSAKVRRRSRADVTLITICAVTLSLAPNLKVAAICTVRLDRRPRAARLRPLPPHSARAAPGPATMLLFAEAARFASCSSTAFNLPFIRNPDYLLLLINAVLFLRITIFTLLELQIYRYTHAQI